MLFFTEEDPRELPQGSRDPLRFLPSATAIGRRLIPNLNTVTPSYRGFLTRLLFHGLLEEEVRGGKDWNAQYQWESFVRFEQLCAIARSCVEESIQTTERLPGVTRASSRVKNEECVVGDDAALHILNTQKGTGLWGYYHQACLASGILKYNNVEPAGYALTDEARIEFLRLQLKIPQQLREVLVQVIAKPGSHTVPQRVLTDLARFFAKSPIGDSQHFWKQYLLQPKQPLERESSEGWPNPQLSGDFFTEVLRAVKALRDDDNLPAPSQIWEWLEQNSSGEVQRIARDNCNAAVVISAAVGLFELCRSRHGSDLKELEATLVDEDEWGSAWKECREDMMSRGNAGNPAEEKIVENYDLLTQKSVEEIIRNLLQQNAEVSASRKGSAWVCLAEDGKTLDVRRPNQADPSCLSAWQYDYFLDSYMAIADELNLLGAPNA